MTFDHLEGEGVVRRQPRRPAQVKGLLDRAEREVSLAGDTVPKDPEWGFAIAYNACLRAMTALMADRGYRSAGPDRHHTSIRFLEAALGEEIAQDASRLDAMRQRRHQIQYDIRAGVARAEAAEAVVFARGFVALIRQRVKR